MANQATELRLEIEVPRNLQETAAALIALGAHLARSEGYVGHRSVDDLPLGISSSMRVAIAVGFATSVAANAAYDTIKAAIAGSPPAAPLSIIQNVTVMPSVTGPTGQAQAAAAAVPAKDTASNKGHQRELGRSDHCHSSHDGRRN